MVELLIVVAIIGIVVSFTSLSLQDLIQNQNAKTRSFDMIQMLELARNTAATRRQFVRVCPTTNSQDCQLQNTNWANPLIAVIDNQQDGTTDELILAHGPSGATQIQTTGFANPSFIEFTPTGWATSAGDISICDNRGPTQAIALRVGAAGHVRVIREDPDQDGVVNLPSTGGGNLSC